MYPDAIFAGPDGFIFRIYILPPLLIQAGIKWAITKYAIF